MTQEKATCARCVAIPYLRNAELKSMQDEHRSFTKASKIAQLKGGL